MRAVIFDVYKTLLDVGPPPPDAQTRWELLWCSTFQTAPSRTLADFGKACEQIILQEHTAAKSTGIPFPEIFWPAVATKALPELERLSIPERDTFLYRQTQLWHTVSLNPGAAAALRQFKKQGLILGIASNAQPYTLQELESALSQYNLSQSLFHPALCFWSFEHGFSKPDPHVFRLLSARLQAMGIPPEQTLMIGDRLDNDIDPARAQGWLTWHLTSSESGPNKGPWTELTASAQANQ